MAGRSHCNCQCLALLVSTSGWCIKTLGPGTWHPYTGRGPATARPRGLGSSTCTSRQAPCILQPPVSGNLSWGHGDFNHTCGSPGRLPQDLVLSPPFLCGVETHLSPTLLGFTEVGFWGEALCTSFQGRMVWRKPGWTAGSQSWCPKCPHARPCLGVIGQAGDPGKGPRGAYNQPRGFSLTPICFSLGGVANPLSQMGPL